VTLEELPDRLKIKLHDSYRVLKLEVFKYLRVEHTDVSNDFTAEDDIGTTLSEVLGVLPILMLSQLIIFTLNCGDLGHEKI